MTPKMLLDQLKLFVEDAVQDILLPCKDPPPKPGEKPSNDQLRAPEVHLMRLPVKEHSKNRVPNIVLEYLTGEDTMPAGGPQECTGRVRFGFTTYSKNDSEGALDVLNLMTRVRIMLLKKGEIGNQFLLKMPMEQFVYPDGYNTEPFFMGEMMTNWEMPITQREVTYGE